MAMSVKEVEEKGLSVVESVVLYADHNPSWAIVRDCWTLEDIAGVIGGTQSVRWAINTMYKKVVQPYAEARTAHKMGHY